MYEDCPDDIICPYCLSSGTSNVVFDNVWKCEFCQNIWESGAWILGVNVRVLGSSQSPLPSDPDS